MFDFLNVDFQKFIIISKVVIASLICLTIYYYFAYPMGVLTALIPIIIQGPSIGSVRRKASQFILGIIIGLLVGAIISSLYTTHYFESLLMLAAWIIISSYNSKNIYTIIFWIVSGLMPLLISYFSIFTPELAIPVSLGILLASLIGCIIYLTIDISFYPQYSKDIIKNSILSMIASERYLLNDILSSFLYGKPPDKNIIKKITGLKNNFPDLHGLLLDMKAETKIAENLERVMSLYVKKFNDLALQIAGLKNTLLGYDYSSNKDMKNHILSIQNKLNSAMSDIALKIKYRMATSFKTYDLHPENYDISDILSKIETLQEHDKTDDKSLNVFHFIGNVRRISNSIKRTCFFLEEIKKQRESIGIEKPNKGSHINLVQRLRIKIESFLSALTFHEMIFPFKTLLSVIIGFYVSLAFDLESGFAVVLTAFFISSPTIGKTLHGTSWRALGVLIGSVLGIACLYYLSKEPSIIMLYILIGAIVYLCACLANSGPSSIATGLQIIVTFFIIMASSPELSSHSLYSAIHHRAIGLIIGGLIAYLVSLFIYPIKTQKVIIKNSSKILELVSVYLEKITSIDVETKNKEKVDLESIKENLEKEGKKNQSLLPFVVYERKGIKYLNFYTSIINIPITLVNALNYLEYILFEEGSYGDNPKEIFQVIKNEIHSIENYLMNASKVLINKKNETLNLTFNYDKDIKEKLETTARKHNIAQAKALVLLDFFKQFILRLEELHGHIKLQDKKE